MPDDERARILAMLEAGRITADQAAVLLDALAARVAGPPAAPRSSSAAGGAPAARPPAQVLRIVVDAHEGAGEATKVNVNVPLKLARFASRFLPPDARRELDAQGIDLGALLADLGDEVPDGPLVDVDARDETGARTARIRIEVV